MWVDKDTGDALQRVLARSMLRKENIPGLGPFGLESMLRALSNSGGAFGRGVGVSELLTWAYRCIASYGLQRRSLHRGDRARLRKLLRDSEGGLSAVDVLAQLT